MLSKIPVRHDLFIRGPWLVFMWDINHGTIVTVDVTHGTLVTWVLTRHGTHVMERVWVLTCHGTLVTIHMTHGTLVMERQRQCWHDLFIHGSRLVYIWDMTHETLATIHITHETLDMELQHQCWHDLFLHGSRLVYNWDMNHGTLVTKCSWKSLWNMTPLYMANDVCSMSSEKNVPWILWTMFQESDKQHSTRPYESCKNN